MKKSTLLMVGLAAACAVAGILILNRPPVEELPSSIPGASSQTEPGPTVTEPLAAAPPQEALSAAADSAPPPPPEVAPAPPPTEPAKPGRKSASAAAQTAQSGQGGKQPLQDPLAREALALVGCDPAAEAYWEAAINDPGLSGHERSDLIEDLNEDGLSDPKNPTLEDLPVILRRIRIIETAGPYAMDQVNADAFQEAYKDLLNLADRTLGGGQPVR